VQYKEDFHLKHFPAGSPKAKILMKIKKGEKKSFLWFISNEKKNIFF